MSTQLALKIDDEPLVPVISIRVIEDPIMVWVGGMHRWVESGLKHDLGLIGASDVFDRILRKHMTLHGIYDGDTLVGGFVTQIESGSRGRALNIISLGGENMDDWLEPLIESLVDYGRTNHCRYIIEMGRKGWRRVLDKHGWVEGPTIMLKVI